MELASFVFGIVIFSIVTTMMFAAVQSILTDNKSSKDPAEWANLAGSYGDFSADVASSANSTSRGISSQTEQGAAGSQTTDVTLITGAVSGGRLTTNFYSNFKEIMEKVGGDTVTYVDPRIIGAIIALSLVFLVLVALHFIRGFKTET